MSESVEEKKQAKSRRGKGEGSICQRKDGLWFARVELGRDANGKRIRKAIYGRSKKEVAGKLTQQASAILNGTSVDPGKMTLGDLLTKWLAESAKPTCSPGSYAEYERMVDRHIRPKIGVVKLSAIRPLHVQSLLTALEDGDVGPRTRQYCFVTLHRAFVVAMRWQLMHRNPCDGVDPPKVARRQIEPLTAEQAIKLLEVSEGNRFYAMFVLAITAGMRQGELFGLQKDSVNLDAGTVTIRHSLEEIKGKLRLKEPKSESGRRQIVLSEMAVKALCDHRKAMLAEGLAGSSYFFPDSNGAPLRKSNFYRNVWKKLRDKVGLGKMHFHDLRHSCASLMLADGVHAKAIQATLGHSTITMTMDNYAHLMPTTGADVAGRFDKILSSKTA